MKTLALLLVALSLGCALTSKGEPLTPRYFSPTLGPAAAEARRDAAPLELRIGRIEPAAHLEERIAYRVDESELAYYDDRRWTEPPEQFVRRALDSQLFEARSFRRVVSGAAPTLDVEVLSFEEVRGGGAPRARLGLLISLRDDRHALLERTITHDVALDAGPDRDPGRALAAAMAELLARAAREVSERVERALAEREGPAVAGSN